MTGSLDVRKMLVAFTLKDNRGRPVSGDKAWEYVQSQPDASWQGRACLCSPYGDLAVLFAVCTSTPRKDSAEDSFCNLDFTFYPSRQEAEKEVEAYKALLAL